jgi:hypothetical protein
MAIPNFNSPRLYDHFLPGCVVTHEVYGRGVVITRLSRQRQNLTRVYFYPIDSKAHTLSVLTSHLRLVPELELSDRDRKHRAHTRHPAFLPHRRSFRREEKA